MTSTITMTKVYLQLHYQETLSNGLSVFREDSFFFPCFDEEQIALTMKYIKKALQKRSDACIYLQRIEDNGNVDNHGVPKSDYINCKMFDRHGEDVCRVMEWSGDRYEWNEHYATVKNTMDELQEEIERQENWC